MKIMITFDDADEHRAFIVWRNVQDKLTGTHGAEMMDGLNQQLLYAISEYGDLDHKNNQFPEKRRMCGNCRHYRYIPQEQEDDDWDGVCLLLKDIDRKTTRLQTCDQHKYPLKTR
jgi:hypothetical protein